MKKLIEKFKSLFKSKKIVPKIKQEVKTKVKATKVKGLNPKKKKKQVRKQGNLS